VTGRNACFSENIAFSGISYPFSFIFRQCVYKGPWFKQNYAHSRGLRSDSENDLDEDDGEDAAAFANRLFTLIRTFSRSASRSTSMEMKHPSSPTKDKEGFVFDEGPAVDVFSYSCSSACRAETINFFSLVVLANYFYFVRPRSFGGEGVFVCGFRGNAQKRMFPLRKGKQTLCT
jgi:hypothetical protein